MRKAAKTKHFPNNTTSNVIGYVEGSDPKLKDEIILVGAHLDEQGNPSVPLPDALDNATGVANILEVARALAQLEPKPKRSVAVLFIGAEECGSVGSGHFVKNSTFPNEEIVCLFNPDMVSNGIGFAVWGADSYLNIHEYFIKAFSHFTHRNFSSSPSRIPRTLP